MHTTEVDSACKSKTPASLLPLRHPRLSRTDKRVFSQANPGPSSDLDPQPIKL